MNPTRRHPIHLLALSLGVLAIAACGWIAYTRGVNPLFAAVCAGAFLPLLGTVATDAPMSETEFQKTVLDGIGGQKRTTDSLVADFDRLTKETKGAFDELTVLKRHANDSSAAMAETKRALERIDGLLRREARMAFGDPIKRIQADERMRLSLNAAFRLAVDSSGDMQRLLRQKFPAEIVGRALGEDSSPGSTLIDDALASEVYDTLAMYGVWNTFRVQRLGTKQTKFPIKTTRPVAGYVLTEGAQISDDTNKAGASVTLEAEVIAVLLNVSLQLIQDAEVDVTADVLDDFAEAVAYRIDWSALAADGGSDATDGAMTGIFGGAGTAAAAASGNTTVATTDLEDWTKCLTTVDPAVLSRQARWWMHPQILVKALSIKDSNGRPIFLTANEAPTPAGIGSILGYPVTLAHAAPSTDSASAKIAVFGDPAGQVVGIRQDFTFEASDHHGWDTFQRSFRGIARAGTKVRRALAFAVLTLAGS